MKKHILAADSKYGKGNIYQYAVSQIDDLLQGIYNHGYTASVTLDDETIDIDVRCSLDEEYMPTITITPVMSDSKLYLTPTLTFPTLTWSEDGYADSIEFYLEKWANLGRFITKVNNFVFDFDKWKYDSADDEWYY